MTGSDICKKALEMISSGKYVYWYGGKTQLCTASLLAGLSASYPSVYTTAYIVLCKRDIIQGKYCTDCSGFVSTLYGWKGLGTYTIKQRSDVKVWSGTPKNGMMLWKPSHIGIYYNGKVLESRGRYYGLTSTRDYKKSDWTCVLYCTTVDYGTTTATKKVTAKVVQDVVAGKYGNGQQRTAALKEAGYTDAQIKIIQQKVNEALKK